ncbi:MAG: V-type ATP synthase subunit I [Lachnospiraceae bacterium]|nr:V-type ATP synthase subunit I [Lachnospiraceae bacterium]
MAVLPMKRITIMALKKDRKGVLEFLQREGAVQIECKLPEDDVFRKQDTQAARTLFQKNAQAAEDALAVLDIFAPSNKGLLAGLNGRKELTVEEYNAFVLRRDEMVDTGRKILALDKELSEIRGQIPKIIDQQTALEPWLSYDLPMSLTETKKTTVFTGTLPNEQTLESIYAQIGEYAPDAEKVSVEIISSSQEQTCIFLICSKKDQPHIQDALRRMSFAKPPISDMNPKEAYDELTRKKDEMRKRENEILEELAGYKDAREDLEFASDYFTMRADKYEIISTLDQSRRTFLLEGYIPAKKAQQLEEALTAQYDLSVETAEPGEDEDVPVLLENNAFAAPVEGVVESFSLPGKGEMDPSFLVAIFYYGLFGLMLSDAGYGIIMAVACGLLLLKFKKMENGLKKSLQMFFFCGIGTTIAGFLYGSFFGDAVNVIAANFFGRDDIKLAPLWFEPISEPMRMLVFCFLIAIIHMFVGLGAKGYMYLKKGQWKEAIYDVLFWYMFVGGLILYLLSVPMITNMMQLSFIIPASAQTPILVVVLVGMVGIVLTAGRESKSWFKRILKGLYGVYGISSWLSDILSYSRLLALGLATGVIAQVFNKMGSMMGGGIVGIIVFILVFLIGQTLNIGINALGAYVHTNRLTFVEFFGKFYEGGGRKFEPFAVNTKYYKFKEDVDL